MKSKISVSPSVIHHRLDPPESICGTISGKLRKNYNRNNVELLPSYGSAAIVMRQCVLGIEE
jgi:hypothetical protein